MGFGAFRLCASGSCFDGKQKAEPFRSRLPRCANGGTLGTGRTVVTKHAPPVSYDGAMRERVVIEVTAFEALSLGELGSRRALVRWSDGSTGEALRWYDDEVLFSEGDHGNSRLMSSRAEPHSVAGSVRAWRGP